MFLHEFVVAKYMNATAYAHTHTHNDDTTNTIITTTSLVSTGMADHSQVSVTFLKHIESFNQLLRLTQPGHPSQRNKISICKS